MGEVPKVFNNQVSNVVLHSEDGGTFGDLPAHNNVPQSDQNSPAIADDLALYYKHVCKIEQLNRAFY
ncbi:unnamed protein product [Peronospora belbahrii]|uniref:Uncharacterized protein n=1 Tax=Peronospora belbahrii TaxID=622444 RepID=A0AAU9KPA4_9STRA|nr:unnamed protein product [Peronospora belbahrii]CAH0520074.1 unnamed protein product [Peronospora belbahrii]